MMPTPTSWRRRRGCGTTPRRRSGTACPCWRTSSGNELRQTGDPDEQQQDLVAVFDRLRRDARLGRVPGRRGGRDHGAEELRGDGLVHRGRPAPGIGPARVLESAGVQHLPQRTPARVRARRRCRPGLRGGPGAQPGHARVLLGRPSAAALRSTCRCAIRSGRWRPPTTRWLDGAAALLVASGCPPRYSPSHTDLLRRVGAGGGGGRSRSSSTWAGRAT